jgi:transposase-like protein
MGMSVISKSQVSRQCEEIDDKVKAFLAHPIECDWIDATYVKVRQNGRSVSVAVIVAVGVNSDGRSEVLSMDIGPSDGETFWTACLRKLARCGLRSIKLVVSDAHEATRPPSPRCSTQPGSAAVFISGATCSPTRVARGAASSPPS